MKKVLVLLAVSILFAFCGCNAGKTAPVEQPETDVADVQTDDTAERIVMIGATSVPHAEILNEIVDGLKGKGIILDVKEFSDWKLLNPSLNDSQLDANFFQHVPYLDDYMANSGQNLVSVGPVHVEPMGGYSEKITSLDELKDGDRVSVPNDATNEARALLLLQNNGLITLKEGAGLEATPNDIEENPYNLEFVELPAAQLPRTLSEVTLAVINTNYALEADLNPMEDALFIEDKDSPFANVLVVRAGDENEPYIKEIYAALTTDEIRQFIEEKYQGAIVPAF